MCWMNLVRRDGRGAEIRYSRSGFVGVGLPIRSGRFCEEPEEFRRNHLWIVQRNKVSPVNHDDFGLRNERTGPLRKLFGYSLVA
jgi:hypothetical protein